MTRSIEDFDANLADSLRVAWAEGQENGRWWPALVALNVGLSALTGLQHNRVELERGETLDFLWAIARRLASDHHRRQALGV